MVQGVGGELLCPVSVVQGGELLCPARVLAVQESAHDWQVPGESFSYRVGERTSMSSLSFIGGRTTMSSPCDRRPGVSS